MAGRTRKENAMRSRLTMKRTSETSRIVVNRTALPSLGGGGGGGGGGARAGDAARFRPVLGGGGATAGDAARFRPVLGVARERDIAAPCLSHSRRNLVASRQESFAGFQCRRVDACPPPRPSPVVVPLRSAAAVDGVTASLAELAS